VSVLGCRTFSPHRPIREESKMNWNRREPTLDEILSDSIVIAVMEADGINPQ
jgi:hypothetical protein